MKIKLLALFLILFIFVGTASALVIGYSRTFAVGGGGTERLAPDSDGATIDWDDGTGQDAYTSINQDWASRDGTLTIASTSLAEVSMKGFANVVSMGAGDSCTQLSIDYYGRDGNGGATTTVEISYSTDGGTVWIGTSTITLSTNSYIDYNVTYSGLSLTQTQVNALQVRLTNISGAGLVADCATLSVEITYE